MNNAIKTVIGILIVAAVLVGIFFILPGQVKYPLIQWYQNNFDDESAKVIEKGKLLTPKQLENKDNSFKVDATLGDLLDANAENVAWHCDVINRETGLYDLYGDGYKVDVQFTKQVQDDTSQHYTNEHIQIQVRAHYENGEVSFEKSSYSIAMAGYGVDEYSRKKIMEEFYKNVSK